MSIVYTKEIQDLTTGEVVTKELFKKHVENAEQFVRAFIEDVGALAKCSGAEQSVILCCLKYLDYNKKHWSYEGRFSLMVEIAGYP